MTGIPRAGGLRLIRIVVMCIAFGVVLNSAAEVYLFTQSQARARENRTLTLKVGHDARVTTNALCVLRGDLEVRVRTSREFLKDHPNGFSGISAKAIRDAAANQQRTIAALSGIDCGR